MNQRSLSLAVLKISDYRWHQWFVTLFLQKAGCVKHNDYRITYLGKCNNFYLWGKLSNYLRSEVA